MTVMCLLVTLIGAFLLSNSKEINKNYANTDERSQNVVNQLRKELTEKESQLRELELSKWSLVKRKEEMLSKQTGQVRQKESELEKCSKELERLKKLLSKSGKEISLLQSASRRYVFKEQVAQQSEASTQTALAEH